MLKKIAIKLIRMYQKISAKTPKTCRFHPTCSEYTLLAVDKYGFSIGMWKGIKRVLKCHPFHPGGYDPV